MTDSAVLPSWAARAAERSPTVQRSRDRSVKQAQVLVDAGRRLVSEKGDSFTINELVKEAGVALQTFYRYFSSKDELLLAVLEDLVLEANVVFEQRVAGIDDPVERLRSHVMSVFGLLGRIEPGEGGGRFVAAQHWRLARSYPDEVAQATRPYTELLQAEIAAATATGQLASVDPARDAWLTSQLVLSVFHSRSFQTVDDPALSADAWRYCLAALGGAAA